VPEDNSGRSHTKSLVIQVKANGRTSSLLYISSSSTRSTHASIRQSSGSIRTYSMARPNSAPSLTGRWPRLEQTWTSGSRHVPKHRRQETRLRGCTILKARTLMRETFTSCTYLVKTKFNAISNPLQAIPQISPVSIHNLSTNSGDI
jgi:hypothetical protein